MSKIIQTTSAILIILFIAPEYSIQEVRAEIVGLNTSDILVRWVAGELFSGVSGLV